MVKTRHLVALLIAFAVIGVTMVLVHPDPRPTDCFGCIPIQGVTLP